MKILIYKDDIYYQVNKQKAERLFNEGKTIHVKQNNANVNSFWIDFADIKKFVMYKSEEGYTFEKALNTWHYYNPRNELGYYPQFFIKSI